MNSEESWHGWVWTLQSLSVSTTEPQYYHPTSQMARLKTPPRKLYMNQLFPFGEEEADPTSGVKRLNCKQS